MTVVEAVTAEPESAIRTIHTDLPVNATFHVWLKAKKPASRVRFPSPIKTENSPKFQASTPKSTGFGSIRFLAAAMWS